MCVFSNLYPLNLFFVGFSFIPPPGGKGGGEMENLSIFASVVEIIGMIFNHLAEFIKKKIFDQNSN